MLLLLELGFRLYLPTLCQVQRTGTVIRGLANTWWPWIEMASCGLSTLCSILVKAVMVMTLKNGAVNLVYPNLRDPLLRAELARGVGHNTYGEPAWPNDLLYMFPICILAIVFLGLGLAIGLPVEVGEPADPFATPLEILPEWFLLPAFEILRAVPNKLLGISGMLAIPVGLSLVPVGESSNRYANPIRRPLATWLFMTGVVASLALGYFSALPLD